MKTLFPTSEQQPPTEEILSRLLRAEWISGHRFEAGRCYLLKWTELGHRRALLLQELIKRHQLDEGLEAAKFTQACLGKGRLSTPVPTPERDFWLACLEQLEIGLEKEPSVIFVHLIATWAPPRK